MTTAYPTALDDLDADLVPGSGANADVPLGEDGAGAYTHPAHHATMAGAIEALQTKVGSGASTPVGATVGYVFQSDGADGSEWGHIDTALSDSVLWPGLRRATVTLSSADILDLHNTPVTLVAAPGAGKYLALHTMTSYYTYGTAAYLTDSSVPVAMYAGGSQGIVAIVDDIQATASKTYTRASNGNTYDASDSVNKAIVAHAAGSTFTLGDGTLTVTVWYSVEDVP